VSVGPTACDLSSAAQRAARAAEVRSLLGAIFLSLLIMGIAFVGGRISGSLALQADAGHVLTDVSALLLSLGAVWLAARPADVRRTFGYYRLEILAAALNGMALMAIAGVILIAAWRRLSTHPTLDVRTMLAAALLGLTANVGGFFLLSRQRVRTLNVRAALWHLLGDILSGVGVLVAAGLIALTHLTWIDPLLSAAIALVIVVGALRLLLEAVNILLEAVPQHLDLKDIRGRIQSSAGVLSVHDLHLWTISNGLYALSAHLVVGGGGDLSQCDAILAAVKDDLRQSFGISHTTLQIESDTYSHPDDRH
jgi:cobalt-zinc-cadmium efflux system protein